MRLVTLVFLAFVLGATAGGLQQQPVAASTRDASHEMVAYRQEPSIDIYTLENLRQYQIQYAHTIQNTSNAIIDSQEIWCPVPASTVNQVVLSVDFNPQPTEFLEDNWGQKVAHYVIADMPAQSSLRISWTAVIQISDVSFHIDPLISLEDIPADIIWAYTADDEKYVLSSQVVRQAAADAIGSESSLHGMVQSIYDYVIDHLYYLKEDGWDDAPTVLTRGNGSCSEYAYVTVALCRANGIPARLVGGTRNRNGGNYVDTVFHRAVEVYLPNCGWVPIDTDLGDTQGRPIFSRYGDHFIFQTSGGRSSLLRWDYRSRLNVADLTLVARSAQWTVTEVSLDQPPVLNAIGNKCVNEGAVLTFTISASDPDGDLLTYSSSNLPVGAAFDQETRIFSWTPGYSQAGVYTDIHFQVSGGQLTDSENITIAVANAIRPDVNDDGSVNVLDMISIGQHWNQTGPSAWIREDINEDGTINVLDATLLGQHWTG